MKSLFNYLQEQLYQELCYIYNQIDESEGGLYKGQLELASFLLDKCENYIKEHKNNNHKYDIKFNINKDELKEFDNIFFNELEIEFNLSKEILDIKGLSSRNIDTSERNLEKRYNYIFKDNILNKINIKIIGNSDIEYDKIRSRIVHELNHLYTYWEIIEDDFNESNNIVPEEYFNILHEWASKTYSKITEHLYLQKSLYKDPNDYYNVVSHLLIYSLTRFERNAFLCEISSYLFDRRGAMKDVKSIEGLLNKCNQYNIYIKEFDIIYDRIINEWNDEQKNILKETYNNIYDTNKSINKILKILKKKNEDTIKKLNSNIKELVEKYKDIPMYVTSYPFESEISFNNPIYQFNFF